MPQVKITDNKLITLKSLITTSSLKLRLIRILTSALLEWLYIVTMEVPIGTVSHYLPVVKTSCCHSSKCDESNRHAAKNKKAIEDFD